SPAVVRELAAPVAARGAALLDVPVSGSTITVEQGQASFIAAGDAGALERVHPFLLAMGTAVTHVGELGLAKTMKVATNLGLAVQMLAFSEAVLLAEKAGIARERAVEALLKSVVASPMVKYRGPFVLGQMSTDAWFKVAMMQKDLQLALDAGRASAVPLPLTQAVAMLVLGDLGLQVGFARIDVAQLALEPGDAALGREIAAEQRVGEQDREQGAGGDEQPRQPGARRVGHGG